MLIYWTFVRRRSLENQKGLVEIIAEKVWKFLSSVKLAVVLLIILAIVSVIGTVIQQNESPERYLQEYSQTTVNLLESLGFFDMYHTWWFVLLLFLLTANLTVCTLDRFPPTWKIIKAPLKPIEDEGLKALPFKKEIVLKGDADQGRTARRQGACRHTLPLHRIPRSGQRPVHDPEGRIQPAWAISSPMSASCSCSSALSSAPSSDSRPF